MIDGVENIKQAPRVYIDLNEDQLKMVQGLKVGSPVKVVLKGVIKAISQREGYESEGTVSGSVDVTYDKLAIARDEKNEIAALLEEDDD